MKTIYVLINLTNPDDTCPIMAFEYKPTEIELAEVCQNHIDSTFGTDDGYKAQIDEAFERSGLIYIFDPNYDDIMSDEAYILKQVDCRV